MKRLFRILPIILALALMLTACDLTGPSASPTPYPTYTPFPTWTIPPATGVLPSPVPSPKPVQPTAQPAPTAVVPAATPTSSRFPEGILYIDVEKYPGENRPERAFVKMMLGENFVLGNPEEIAVGISQAEIHPLGRWLFGNGDRRNQMNLLAIRRDGRTVGEISSHLEDAHPRVSPDGVWLVYDTTAPPTGKAISKDDWQLALLDLGPLLVEDPNYLTDGFSKHLPARIILGWGGQNLRGKRPSWISNDSIIYQGFKPGEGEPWDQGLYTTNPFTASFRADRVTSNYMDTCPNVFGKTVVFMTVRPGTGNDWEIYSTTIGNGLDVDLKQLTNNSVEDGLPVWSPDGQWIAFVSNEGGNWGIWVMKPDGSSRVCVRTLWPTALGPDWTDGQLSWTRNITSP